MRTMTAQEILEQARDSMTVKRVFGEPYEKNGVTVLPAAKIAGGGGGGDGQGAEGRGGGSGGGFGLREKPAGAFVIRGDDVRWIPSLDVNRIILGGQIVAIVAILASVLRRRMKSRATA
jgi:uncharacterized spore protein YtfJ